MKKAYNSNRDGLGSWIGLLSSRNKLDPVDAECIVECKQGRCLVLISGCYQVGISWTLWMKNAQHIMQTGTVLGSRIGLLRNKLDPVDGERTVECIVDCKQVWGLNLC